MAIIKTKRQQRNEGWLVIAVAVVIAILEGAGVNVLGLFFR